jgi:hypothetical protein
MAFGFLLPPWKDFCETCKKVYPTGTGYNEYFCSKECEEKKLKGEGNDDKSGSKKGNKY